MDEVCRIKLEMFQISKNNRNYTRTRRKHFYTGGRRAPDVADNTDEPEGVGQVSSLKLGNSKPLKIKSNQIQHNRKYSITNSRSTKIY